LQPTILCVDDDRNFCEILAKAFKAEGYAVRTAHDGETALRSLREAPPSLVTLDILLPRQDGFRVLEQVRALRGAAARTPALLLSGCSPTPQYRSRAAELGAAALLTKPVPLERLLEVAGKATGSAVAARVEPRAGEARPIAGQLEKVPFAALLHHLHGLRASGVLHLESGKKRKKLQLRDGRPVAVKSNLVDECLGNLLAATGSISWDVMHESLRRVKRGEGPQGQILMAMHMLDEEDLARALRRQAAEKLLEIFSWESGRFRFQRGVRLKGANALALRGSPANLIVEGVRSRLPAAAMESFFLKNGAKFLIPSESPFYRFQEIELTPTEEKLLRRIDGAVPIGRLAARVDEAARRTLYGAIAIGLFEVRRAAPAPAVAKSAAPRPPVAARRAAAAKPESVAPAQEEGARADLSDMAANLRGRDFFSILGLEHRTDDEEVRCAYVELAKRTHPDRYSGFGEAVKQLAEEVFGLVSEAYQNLADQERRLAYLRSLRNRERDAEELEEGQRALRAELAFQRGVAALGRKDNAGAAGCFEEAVRTYPEEGEYHAWFGWAWYLTDPSAAGRLDEALEHVREGRKLAPDREKPYLFLGKLYKAADRKAIAERMFTRALQLDPDCVEAIRELRLLHMRREKSKGLMKRILRR
jgi:CheY-like chemotaxis protein